MAGPHYLHYTCKLYIKLALIYKMKKTPILGSFSIDETS
nr:MAG TPA: hypothetical protein [Caudoviricetes sp.]